MRIFVVCGELHGEAQCTSARNYSYLVQRVCVIEQPGDECVSSFMIGGDFLFFGADNHGASFCAHHYFVFCLLQQFKVNFFSACPCGHQCGFINKVFKICSGKSRGPTGKHIQVHLGGHFGFFCVYLKYFLSSTDIRDGDNNLTVKTSRPEQGRVKDIWSVGGRHDDDTVIGFKTIHLNQELVQSLFSLIMTSAKTGTAMTSDRIYLINKDNTGGALFPLGKHIPDTGGTDTYEHFNKVGPGNTEKRNICFSGNGLSQ